MDNWQVFGLGGLWKGKAKDAADAIRQARNSGVLVVSWAKKDE